MKAESREPVSPSAGVERRPGDPQSRRGLLIHPLSAILLIAIDNLWTLGEWMALAWIVTVPLSFLAVFIPTLLIQRFLRGDSFVRAAAVGSVLAVLAAVPTPVTGTTTGAVALGLSGLKFLRAERDD